MPASAFDIPPMELICGVGIGVGRGVGVGIGFAGAGGSFVAGASAGASIGGVAVAALWAGT